MLVFHGARNQSGDRSSIIARRHASLPPSSPFHFKRKKGKEESIRCAWRKIKIDDRFGGRLPFKPIFPILPNILSKISF